MRIWCTTEKGQKRQNEINSQTPLRTEMVVAVDAHVYQESKC